MNASRFLVVNRFLESYDNLNNSDTCIINRIRVAHHNQYWAINEHDIYIGIDSYLESIMIFDGWYKVSEDEVTMWHDFVTEQLRYMEEVHAPNLTDLQQYLESIVVFDQFMEFLNEQI